MIKVGRDPLPGERVIRLGFVGFHESFNIHYNHLSLQLRDVFPIVTCEKNEVPDFLFFSVFDSPHHESRYANCVKIFTCEENIRPPWSECHYALTGDRIVPPEIAHRHLRLPIYARYLYHLRDHTGRTLVESPKVIPRARKKKFCNFVYSNGRAKERLLFLELISKYKRVDSGGGLLNNLGYRVGDKLAFLEDYKFTIAFENSRYPGYISEKLVEPMVSGSIPIYWGDPLVGEDFNPRSFVDANESPGQDLRTHFEDVVERVAWLDQHDDEYAKIITEPWFVHNLPNQYCNPDRLRSFMRGVFDA